MIDPRNDKDKEIAFVVIIGLLVMALFICFYMIGKINS